MRGYLRTFLLFAPSLLRRAALLDFAVALTEGAGLMLLLPLLALAGGLGPMQASLPGRLFSELGVSWNIGTALLVFVALVFLLAQLSMHRDRAAHELQVRFGDHLRETLYAALARTRWSFLSSRHSGELSSVLSVEVQRIVGGTYFLLRLFAVAVLGLAYLSVALWLSLWLTLLALATGGVLWLLLRGADGAVRQSGVLLSQGNRKLFSQMQEFLAALKLIKIHGEEADSLYRFKRELESVSAHMTEFNRTHTRVRATYRVGGALALAVVSYAALAWFNLPPAHLLVMVAIFARMLPQLAELHGGKQQLLHMLPAFAAWRGLLDACEAARDPQASSGAAAPLTLGIAFENVGFSHAQSHHSLLIERLFIPARQTTAILGVSGSGKTTLLDLLSGLLAPDRGIIRVDGMPLAQLGGWRQSIAYIPQETHIRNGSVRENLMWGNEAPGEEELWRALEQAALADLVRRLPQELDTEVGERGVKLSGGEKQRLALARALLRRPQLLILDEATSALDADNHRLVLDSIRALHGSMTVLVVTHRHEELAGLIDGVVQVEGGIVGQWSVAENTA
jgi:ATP-binding cassette subfamily C protein